MRPPSTARPAAASAAHLPQLDHCDRLLLLLLLPLLRLLLYHAPAREEGGHGHAERRPMHAEHIVVIGARRHMHMQVLPAPLPRATGLRHLLRCWPSQRLLSREGEPLDRYVGGCSDR